MPEVWYWDKKNNKTASGACKLCHRDRSRKWAADNQARRDALRYGVSEEEAARLRAVTQCQLCGSGKKLCIDHCHDTGQVRGVLCHECNTSIGKLGDTVESLEKAVRYLKREVQ